jgi:hypothetical protein
MLSINIHKYHPDFDIPLTVTFKLLANRLRLYSCRFESFGFVVLIVTNIFNRLLLILVQGLYIIRNLK